jgi:arsenate reductase
MAEALARHLASDIIEAESAGVSPFGRIADMTRSVLHERGIETEKLRSKGLRDTAAFFPDLVINMSGITGKSLFPGIAHEDWEVEDPWGEDVVTYRRICEDIEERVRDLAERLRRETATP